MPGAFDPSPEVIAAIASSGGTLVIGWLIRRDKSGRETAIETQRVAEVERRIVNLESSHISVKEMESINLIRAEIQRRVTILEFNAVTQRDMENLTHRLDSIQNDLRDVRLFQLGQKTQVQG